MKNLSIPLLLLALAGGAAQAAVPAPVTALLTQSREAQDKGDTDLALRLAQAAIVADPAQTVSYVALGALYAAQGQAEYARSYYELALQIDPQDAGALAAIAALAALPKAAANTP